MYTTIFAIENDTDEIGAFTGTTYLASEGYEDGYEIRDEWGFPIAQSDRVEDLFKGTARVVYSGAEIYVHECGYYTKFSGWAHAHATLCDPTKEPIVEITH